MGRRDDGLYKSRHESEYASKKFSRSTYEDRRIDNTEAPYTLDGEIRVERTITPIGGTTLAHRDGTRDVVDNEGVGADVFVNGLVGGRVRRGAKLRDDPIPPRVRPEEAATGLEGLAHRVDVKAVLIAKQPRVDDRVREWIRRVESQTTAYPAPARPRQ